jgi:FkbM family methyltransferase
MSRYITGILRKLIKFSGYEPYIRKKLYNSSYLQQLISTTTFAPYIKELSVAGKHFRFFFATPEARAWYDPMKPYAALEYEWVLNNIDLKHQKIIDAGAHHGQYSVIFALGTQNSSQVVAVDPFPSNCSIIEANMAINHVEAQIVQCAVSDSNGYVLFANRSNGRIVTDNGVRVPSKRLATILPNATIIKLDIEGAEFSVLPDQIDDMSSCHTWIVEVHPGANQAPEVLIDAFKTRGFSVFWVNRHNLIVEDYPVLPNWDTHTTIFAFRDA